MTEKELVAGYYRVSVARDGMHSPDIYREEIERYCTYKDLKLVEIYDDIDRSGYNDSRTRPGLTKLLADRGRYSAVVVPKLSRFGRSLAHLMELFEIFEKDAIDLVFLDIGIDTSTSQGKLLRNIMAAFAEFESDVKSDYSKANRRHALTQGRPFGGQAPLGYVYDRAAKTYSIDRDAAPVVRRIFKRYIEGATQTQIALELNRDGTEKPRGGRYWDPGVIARLLDNPTFISRSLLDGELIPGNWPPIIETDVWERAQARRKTTRERWAVARGPRALLAGLIYCGDCGRKAYINVRGKGLPGRYRCPRIEFTGEPICRGPGVNARRADEYVTQRYLIHSKAQLLQGTQGVLTLGSQWELATRDERRMLLAAAIERIVVEPTTPQHRKYDQLGRRLEIMWKAVPTPLDMPPPMRHTKSRARGAQLARVQLAEIERAKSAAGQRTKTYYAEWAEHQVHLREAMQTGAQPQPKVPVR